MPDSPRDTQDRHVSDASPDSHSPGGRSQTLAAGQAFLSTVGSDIGSLARRFRFTGREARSHRRPKFAALALGVAFVMLLGCVTFAGAMFWALHDLPAEKPFGDNNAPS